MGKFFKFVAVVLLATWLPVTQHAALEMMGILPDHSDQVSHHHDDGHAESPEPHGSHDTPHDWHLVEKTIVKSSTGSLKSPVISVLFTVTLLCGLFAAVLKLRAEVFTRIERQIFQRPLDWVPDWHFVRRAVASPRAPAFIA